MVFSDYCKRLYQVLNLSKSVKFSTLVVGLLLLNLSPQLALAADNYDHLSLNDAVDIALKNNIAQLMMNAVANLKVSATAYILLVVKEWGGNFLSINRAEDEKIRKQE